MPALFGAFPPPLERLDPDALGPFHTYAVHVPIPLLLLAACCELRRAWRRDALPSRTGTPCLVIGALGGALAAALGWLLAPHATNQLQLEAHRWLGAAAAGAALSALALRPLASGSLHPAPLSLYRAMVVLSAMIVVAATITGHQHTHPTNAPPQAVP